MVLVDKEHSRLKNVAHSSNTSLTLLKCANVDWMAWVNPKRAAELGQYEARRQPIGNCGSRVESVGRAAVGAHTGRLVVDAEVHGNKVSKGGRS